MNASLVIFTVLCVLTVNSFAQDTTDFPVDLPLEGDGSGRDGYGIEDIVAANLPTGTRRCRGHGCHALQDTLDLPVVLNLEGDGSARDRYGIESIVASSHPLGTRRKILKRDTLDLPVVRTLEGDGSARDGYGIESIVAANRPLGTRRCSGHGCHALQAAADSSDVLTSKGDGSGRSSYGIVNENIAGVYHPGFRRQMLEQAYNRYSRGGNSLWDEAVAHPLALNRRNGGIQVLEDAVSHPRGVYLRRVGLGGRHNHYPWGLGSRWTRPGRSSLYV